MKIEEKIRIRNAMWELLAENIIECRSIHNFYIKFSDIKMRLTIDADDRDERSKMLQHPTTIDADTTFSCLCISKNVSPEVLQLSKLGILSKKKLLEYVTTWKPITLLEFEAFVSAVSSGDYYPIGPRLIVPDIARKKIGNLSKGGKNISFLDKVKELGNPYLNNLCSTVSELALGFPVAFSPGCLFDTGWLVPIAIGFRSYKCDQGLKTMLCTHFRQTYCSHHIPDPNEKTDFWYPLSLEVFGNVISHASSGKMGAQAYNSDYKTTF